MWMMESDFCAGFKFDAIVSGSGCCDAKVKGYTAGIEIILADSATGDFLV